MNANESESAEKLLSALKKMTCRDFFESRRGNGKFIKFLQVFEKLMILILSISFLFSVFVLFQLFTDFALFQPFTEATKISLLGWSLGLIVLFSALLFLYKFIEMRCIHQFYCVDGFLAPNASNFKSAFNRFSLVIDEIKEIKTQDLEIGLMQYRCMWHPVPDLFDAFLRSSIFLSFLSPFIATLWRDFFNFSNSNRIELSNTAQEMTIGLVVLSLIVYIFYKRLDVAQIFSKKQRHACVVILLEYVIRLRREEERRME